MAGSSLATSDKTPTRLTNQAVRPPLKRTPRGPLRLSGFETYTTHSVYMTAARGADRATFTHSLAVARKDVACAVQLGVHTGPSCIPFALPEPAYLPIKFAYVALTRSSSRRTRAVARIT